MKKDYIKNIDNGERRYFTSSIEVRADSDDMVIEGIAAVVNKETDLGWYTERIDKGAFDDSLKDDVRALLNHDSNYVLARSNNGEGTLDLFITDNGDLGYRYNTPNVGYAKDLHENIRLGNISQSSFAFTIAEDAWEFASESNGLDKDVRTIKKIDRLYDVSPVTYPAYADTDVSARSAEKAHEGDDSEIAIIKEDKFKRDTYFRNKFINKKKMSNLKKLMELRSEVDDKINAINTLVTEEGRARTEDEAKEWKSLEAEYEKLSGDIDSATKLEARNKEAAKAKIEADKIARAVDGSLSSKSEEREIADLGKKFRFTKGMGELRGQKPLTGVEAELTEEARNETEKLEGNLAIPAKFVKILRKSDYLPNGEKRDLTIATEGADVRPLDLQGVIPILAPNPVVAQMGASVFQGLNGNVQFPRHNGAAAMAWEGETDAGAETTPTFDKITLSPNRVGGYVDISQTFIRQASFDAESWVRNELNRAFAQAIDVAAINGSGSGDQPTGILNQSIGSSDVGTNGGAATWAVIKGNYENVEAADGGTNLAALTHPSVKYALMGIPKQSSGVEGNFVISDQNNMPSNVLGYPVYSSTNIPSTLTKGTGTALHAYIVGNWAELLIGQWGGIDLLVDPYTQAASGLVRMLINGYFDVDVKHVASFSASDDLTV